MMSMCLLGFIVSASGADTTVASQVATTQGFMSAAAAALGIDDSESSQLTSAAEQQKAHDYNDMWDGLGSSNPPTGILQKPRYAGSNSSVTSVRSPEAALHTKASNGTNGGGATSNSARAASPPAVKTDPVYDNWKLHLEKSLLHAVTREASRGTASSRGSRFAPSTSRNSSVAKTGAAAAPAARGARVRVKTPAPHPSVSSLAGSMATAIKESASELERERSAAKREQAEARRQVEEAKSEQAAAKHAQEKAARERSEAKRTLAKAKRVADAAFSAGAISSSRGVAHSQLRPKREERVHLDASSEPAPARSHGANLPKTESPGTSDPTGGAGPSTEHPQHRNGGKSSAHAGASWKMFGRKEWRPSGAASKTGSTVHQPANSEEVSSEDLLNAELVAKLGTPASALRGA